MVSAPPLINQPGTDVIIFKYFRQKIRPKIGFFTQSKAKLCKHSIMTLVFEKNDNFVAENCRKLSKIAEN
jgi:hypothetical protein